MLDLLVVHPGAAHGIYGVLGDDLVAVEPPVWARIVAGYVQDAGYKAQILDAEAVRLGPDEVAAEVLQRKPRLVCLAVYGHQPSASTQQMYGASLTATAIKRIWPDCKIVMIGGHVAALPERTLNEEADVDYVAIGEGPATVLGLLDDNDVMSVPGLVHRTSKFGVRVNVAPPLVENLRLYHGDTWHMLSMEKYRAHNWQCFGDFGARQPYASVYTSLGCPYKCSFCCINAPFNSNRYRMREPGDVVAEILMLRERYGVRTFKIVDEMFVLNERHYVAIAQMLVDSGVSDELNIWAYSRVDTVKSGHLPLLRRAGFRWLALGIESASAFVREGSHKRMRRDDIADVVRGIQAAGINVIGNYIFGLPDDDVSSMQATLEMAIELRTEFANFYSAMAYPGSPLFVEANQRGWKLPRTWRGYSQHNDDCRPLDTRHVSAATVLQFRDTAFNDYFRHPLYLEMVQQKFGDETLEHVLSMTKYKLTRKLFQQRELETA